MPNMPTLTLIGSGPMMLGYAGFGGAACGGFGCVRLAFDVAALLPTYSNCRHGASPGRQFPFLEDLMSCFSSSVNGLRGWFLPDLSISDFVVRPSNQQ